MKKQSIIIKAATILLLVIITTFKAKADNYEIIIEPYLENKPTSVGELQYRCILLMTKDKIPQKKISKIEQLYREICNKEPEWSAYAMYKKAMALGYQPAEFQYSYTLITRGAYSQTTEYPTIVALAGKNYQPAEDLLKLYESGYYTNTYQNEDIAGMLALQSIANRNNGTVSSQTNSSNAGVQGNGNSNSSSSSSGSSTSTTRKTSNEFAYVKTVPGILDSAKPEIVNVYIYKNEIGTYRVSNIFSSNGLDLAATFPINNNGRKIGDKYYGHYYSSYGLCTYFNY